MSGKLRVASLMLARSKLGFLIRRARAASGLIALAYHRIGEGSGSQFDHALWSATADAFDAQVRLLKRDFDVIAPMDLSEARRCRNGKYVLITFDDGYRDNYTRALPILKSHGVTATFFVTTGFIDRPQCSWWDEIAWMVRRSRRRSIPSCSRLARPVVFDEPGRERAVCTLLETYKALPGSATAGFMDYLADATGSGRCTPADTTDMWMTWDMIREMRKLGMCIGGHTVNHPILSKLSRELQRQEIAGCRKRFEAELQERMRWLSYPRGKPDSFNGITRECLREEGVELAFSYYGGFQQFGNWDPYDMRRTAVEMETTLEQFQAMVTLPQLFA